MAKSNVDKLEMMYKNVLQNNPLTVSEIKFTRKKLKVIKEAVNYEWYIHNNAIKDNTPVKFEKFLSKKLNIIADDKILIDKLLKSKNKDKSELVKAVYLLTGKYLLSILCS